METTIEISIEISIAIVGTAIATVEMMGIPISGVGEREEAKEEKERRKNVAAAVDVLNLLVSVH